MNPAPGTMAVLLGNQESLSKAQSRMDQYDLLEQVGKGAFGAAILVMHRAERQKYVMKKIRLARQSERAKRSAYQEMRLVSTLNHPHIVSCHDCWVEKGVYVCIVTGYCEGGDVAELLRRAQGRLFSEGRLIKWLVQILLALQYIHSHKVLHRDLKCSNLFLTRDGDIRVGDFGLARILEQNQLTTSVVGTPNYMCPELLADQPYGFKSDVWSLGCCMYELTGHRPPFKAFDMQGLIQKITKGAVPPLPAEYSADWKAVIRSMLKKIPERRPSVDDLLEHPYLLPHVKACRRRVADASSPRGSPQPERLPSEFTCQKQPTCSDTSLTNGLSASAETPRMRKSAEGRIGEQGFEVSDTDAALLRRSAEGVRNGGSLDGFGPEPSSSPQAVIGSRIRTGVAGVKTVCTSVNRDAEVGSGGRGFGEGEGFGGEAKGFGATGKNAGESGFVAARVQNLEALSRRNSIWMEGKECPPSEIGGNESPVAAPGGVSDGTARDKQARGVMVVGTRFETNSDCQSQSVPGVVTSQKPTYETDETDRRTGNRSGQLTADSLRQRVQIRAGGSNITLTNHSSGTGDVTATSATDRQLGTLDSGSAAWKKQPESPRTTLKNGDAPNSKKDEFQKRVPALGIPGASARTSSKGSVSSSASTTPSQSSPRSPLPKQKPAWGFSLTTLPNPKKPLTPKTSLTLKNSLTPKTSLTEANSGNLIRKPLPKRPATALPRNSAAVQKVTSPTLPARPQTAIRSKVTRGTIPGVARKGLTATTERGLTAGKRFDVAAPRKAAVSQGGGPEKSPAKLGDTEGVTPLATIIEHVLGGPIVPSTEGSQPEQTEARPEKKPTREEEFQPKAKSRGLGSSAWSIFTPISSNKPKAGPVTPSKSPKRSPNGLSPSTRPSTPTAVPGSLELVSSPGETPGSTPRGSVLTPGFKVKPRTSSSSGTAPKTPGRSGATRSDIHKLDVRNLVDVNSPAQSPRPPSPLKSRPASAANTPTPRSSTVTGLTLLKRSAKASPKPSPKHAPNDLSAGSVKATRHAGTPTGRPSQASTPRKVSSFGAGSVAEFSTPEASPFALARAELKRRGFSPSNVGASPEAAANSGVGGASAGQSVADTWALHARVNELEDVLARCCRLHNQQRFEELGALLTTVAQASAALGELVGAPAVTVGGELERAFRQGQAGRKVSSPEELHVGDLVLVVHRNQPGVVRFRGLTQFGDGEWVGVELQVPAGKHNGTWQGVTYFTCPEKHGIFVRATSLQLSANVSSAGSGPAAAVSSCILAGGADVSNSLTVGGANVTSGLSASGANVSSGLIGGGADISSSLLASAADVSSMRKTAEDSKSADVSTAELNQGHPLTVTGQGAAQQAKSDVTRAAFDVRALLVGDGSGFERSANGLEWRTEAAAIGPLSLRNSYDSPRSSRPMSPAKRRLFLPVRKQPEPKLAEGDENAPVEGKRRSPSPMRQRDFTQVPRSPSPLKQRAGPSSPLPSFSGRLMSPPRKATSPDTAQGSFSPVRRER